MSATSNGLRFKLASAQHELEQVHSLNYRTFVEEIPQHEPKAAHRLVDPFLDQSALYICLDDEDVVGMVAISGTRPFSLDRKLSDLDSYLPEGDWSPCEVRLLTIEKAYRRRGDVLIGLLRMLLDHALAEGYDMGLISAATSQLSLYRRIGFRPFGPPLGTEAVPFQGMYVSFERARRRLNRLYVARSGGGLG